MNRKLSADAIALVRAWERFHDCASTEALAPRVFESLVEVCGADCGYMLLAGPQDDDAYLCAVRRLPDPGEEIAIGGDEIDRLQGNPLVASLESPSELTAEALTLVEALDRRIGFSEERRRRGLWISLVEDDLIFGFVRLVCGAEAGECSTGLLTALAQNAVWQMRRAALSGDPALEATCRLVARVVDAATGDEHHHSRLVGECARLIADEMGLPEARCRLTERAGYLHDVGKISALRQLAEAPARLEGAQREQIRSAIREGIEALARVQSLRPMADILLQMGEAWDGSGHPKGLTGEEIALEARILSAVHRFYLALQARPHRGNLTAVSHAVAFLEGQAGKDFDPRVVEALVTAVAGPGGALR
ncbi:MAG: hypothetical protein COZ06_35275 [Armatimonadetes bacterium CG_4_10_14_3_um_filter_66_18]|nr:HD domain-containing protein [Armatimonadota bacterium]OIO92211.1 MAG: hypothetical protein AUJ96_32705 [Armatimonadetes bacterium CG2_30_66_41]PIU87923.1 MAG: hypothetical protein COS65_32100 [Armatimonadetes bacterium CG06_land_8_20_14_3_00_66_21]PIX45009.1 MAG: hypothetical protein COZ57_16455 [Armatimonadetes bacterium CG_4_8_14_3_um_filter_66_20]PIY36665.1 MAG: hypothetical protein COZ06_35275 [Armatimonadetes bacterium CG_4_10_14_3_um_filter_66_18]PIZ33523.1 MAG: hypothetical protein 